MEIQYAIFCKEIRKKPDTTLIGPIQVLSTNTLRSINIPLWLSFVDGVFGVKYEIKINISTQVLGDMGTQVFNFTWDTKKPFVTTVVYVKVPPLTSGFYNFLISVDGHQALRKILIEQERTPSK